MSVATDDVFLAAEEVALGAKVLLLPLWSLAAAARTVVSFVPIGRLLPFCSVVGLTLPVMTVVCILLPDLLVSGSVATVCCVLTALPVGGIPPFAFSVVGTCILVVLAVSWWCRSRAVDADGSVCNGVDVFQYFVFCTPPIVCIPSVLLTGLYTFSTCIHMRQCPRRYIEQT